MPKHVRRGRRGSRFIRCEWKKFRYINYRLLLWDIQVRAAFDAMTSSEESERRHRDCLL